MKSEHQIMCEQTDMQISLALFTSWIRVPGVYNFRESNNHSGLTDDWVEEETKYTLAVWLR